jgi:septum formation protein
MRREERPMAAVRPKAAQTHSEALILASASPRRRALLGEAGIAFEVVEPPLAEPHDGIDRLPPAQQAEALAYYKARSVACLWPACRVLGADTVVALAGEVLHKPADADDARRMLRTLSRSRHAVITGVALLGPGPRRRIASERTWVRMRPMSEAEIDAYVDSGEWQGKAGAYAIQETADRFVTEVDGSFTNVVGLPMELVCRLLAEAGSGQGA